MVRGVRAADSFARVMLGDTLRRGRAFCIRAYQLLHSSLHELAQHLLVIRSELLA
jgi:hypothetical protein